VETVSAGLRALGHEVSRATTATRAGFDIALVLAPHLLRAAGGADTVRAGDIVYNFEPPSSRLFNASLPVLGRAGVSVWDYSRQGTAVLRRLGLNAKHVPLGYAPEVTKLKPGDGSASDVLFYGSMNDRRKRVLDELESKGLRVRHLFSVYGQERDRAIEATKLVLNLHYYDDAPTEDVRITHAIANRAAVVSEGPPDDPRKWAWAAWVPYDELAKTCQELCASQVNREFLADEAFAAFAIGGPKEADLLSEALGSSSP
jgi:hypothetical protein